MAETTTSKESTEKQQTSAEMVQNTPDIFAGVEQQAAGEQQATQQAATQTTQDQQQAAGQQQAAPTQEQASALLQRLQSLGFQGVTDEKQATERLLAAYEIAEQQRAQQQANMEYLRNQALVMQSQLAQISQQAPQAGAGAKYLPAGQQQPEDPWPQIPQIDYATQQAIQRFRNEDGTWKPETPPNIIQTFMQFEGAIDNWQRKLVTNPREALRPLIEHEARRLLREEFGAEPKELVQRMDVDGSQAEAARAWESVEPWMWQADPRTGQPMRNMPTEFGARFKQTFDEQFGMIQELNPTLSDQRAFSLALRQAYRIHEQDLSYLNYRWQEYQKAQQAGGNGQQQPQGGNGQQAAVDQREAAKQQHLAQSRSRQQAATQAAGTFTESEKGRRKQPRQSMLDGDQAGRALADALSGDGFFQ